ncbi:alpha-glucuronidase family glycosyl hydrolase [Neolewinella agarilytica]|uniref:Xylan alpha-1,2-glucuronidase n=1 Tax=Neolewinella agarilytica TaxID=478744 RepID=A0A1H9E434_9BACT|nr:alpha-glucuronidase family glycosyl hydrolase [Neolewinella agarilytica]SEQ20387.1 alpha-glucuronidase [Neolewinella agarilytica]
MRLTPVFSLTIFLLLITGPLGADDGYRLWLRYDEIADSPLRKSYAKALPRVFREGDSPQLCAAEEELLLGLSGLLGHGVESTAAAPAKGLILGVLGRSTSLDGLLSAEEQASLPDGGYALIGQGKQFYIAGKDDRGALYGAFAFLRYLQRGRPLDDLHLLDGPRVKNRLLNHWDNLDGTVERGYAGFSIWNWHQLPHYLDPRYTDYARANASIGINGAVVTNVNAKAIVFRRDYLQKAAALAEVFRPYGIRIYLTARFSAPIELGGLPTADPEDAAVKKWWQDKASEIYALIPDFGGFVVKANSEGQPGPREYGRTHAQGANLLADALAPHGGIVMWRAFVYSNEEPVDRAKQAYDEFVPLDGKFRDNVMVQVKNGPIDFQPREPVHPLFGSMPHTPLAMEFQITKEYLGQGTHLVGLGKMYEEVLQTDTYAEGPGTRVADIIDGSAYGDDRLTAMAGVANIGTARNWTGNLFGQADWYTFGRLAWNPTGKAEDYFREWSQMTFPNSPTVQETAQNLLAVSHEACVNYMTPLGLHHIMGPDHHYGPGPWIKDMPRADWTSVYYHKADAEGVGFDRTKTGSDALEQYTSRFAARYESPDSCPPAFLLWYHHLPWDHKLPSGNTLWAELCYSYHAGATKVGEMLKNWKSLSGRLDQERYESVRMHLEIQEKEAKWWRDACLAYFQSFSGMPVPAELEKPTHSLEYYEGLTFPYAPGIKAKW